MSSRWTPCVCFIYQTKKPRHCHASTCQHSAYAYYSTEARAVQLLTKRVNKPKGRVLLSCAHEVQLSGFWVTVSQNLFALYHYLRDTVMNSASNQSSDLELYFHGIHKKRKEKRVFFFLCIIFQDHYDLPKINFTLHCDLQISVWSTMCDSPVDP